MKRKCLIEDLDSDDLENFGKRFNSILTSGSSATTMHKNTIWYRSLQTAEKSCLKEEKIKKIHYKFDDEREMVEEYNIDTQVLLRRAWKLKGKLGVDEKWEVEVGDPIPNANRLNTDAADIMECQDQVNIEFSVFLSRNNNNLISGQTDKSRDSSLCQLYYRSVLHSIEQCSHTELIIFCIHTLHKLGKLLELYYRKVCVLKLV